MAGDVVNHCQDPRERVLLRAEEQLARGLASAAANEFIELLANSASMSEREHHFAMRLLRFARSNGLDQATDAVLKAILRLRPSDVAALFETGERLAEQRAWRPLNRLVEDRLRPLDAETVGFSEYFFARRCLAAETPGDISRKDFQRARAIVGELLAERPSWPNAHILAGHLARHVGNPSGLTAAFADALEAGDQRPWVRAEILEHASRAQRWQTAIPFLPPETSAGVVQPRLASAAIDVLIGIKKEESAIQLARGVMQHGEDRLDAVVVFGQTLCRLARDREDDLWKEGIAALRLGVGDWPREEKAWTALFESQRLASDFSGVAATLQSLALEGEERPPRARLLRARFLALLKRNRAAATEYEAAARQSPGQVEVLLEAGRFLSQFRPEEAQRMLRECAELAPNSAEPLRLWARVLLRSGKPTDRIKAVALLERLTRDFVPNLDDVLLLAESKESLSDFPMAEKFYKQAIEMSDSPAALSAYASYLLRLGRSGASGTDKSRVRRALSLTRRLRRMTPDDLEALELEARCLQTLSSAAITGDNVNQAPPAVLEAVDAYVAHRARQNPDAVFIAALRSRVARLYERLELPELAGKELEFSRKVHPLGYRGLADHLVAKRQFAPALDLCLQEARTKDEFSEERIALLATFVGRSIGRVNAEKAAYRAKSAAILENLPQDARPETCLSVGVAWVALEDDQQAMRCFRETVTRTPRNSQAWSWLIRTQVDTGDGVGATKSIVMARDSVGWTADTVAAEGYVHLVNGNADQAARHFRDATAMGDEEDPLTLMYLAAALLAAGQEMDAQECLQRSLRSNAEDLLIAPNDRKRLQDLIDRLGVGR